MSDAELKPCPFCGKQPKVMNEHNHAHLDLIYWCECPAMKDVDYMKVGEWNTRTTEHDALNQLRTELEQVKKEVPPVENGKNRYGVDVSYFRNVINRELNRGLSDYKPDELARVCARIAMTADSKVLLEPEFSEPTSLFAELIKDAIIEAENTMVKYPHPNKSALKFAEESGEVVRDAVHCSEGRQTLANLRGEMKQAIAMIYRLCVEGDGTIGLPPVFSAADNGEG